MDKTEGRNYPQQKDILFINEWNQNPAATNWKDGLFIGNGSTGVLCSAPSYVEWLINKNDLYDSTVKMPDFVSHSEVMRRVNEMDCKHTLFLEDMETDHHHDLRSTISAAVLRLKFWTESGWNSPAVPHISQCLNLFNAEMKHCLNAPFLHPEIHSFVSRSKDVLCVHINEITGQAQRIELIRPENELLDDPEWMIENDVIAFKQKLPCGYSYAVALAFSGEVSLRHGKRYGECTAAKEYDCFLSVRTSHKFHDPLAEAIHSVRHARKHTYSALKEEHQNWWHNFWEKSFADFASEQNLGKVWYYSVYTLACSYGTTPMPGLNGLTYGPEDSIVYGIGSQGYTHDQNVQIPMLPFFPLNHCNFVETFANTYLELQQQLEQMTKERFGCSGIYLPLNMNQDGKEIPVGGYRYTLCGSAYSGIVLVRAWQYSHDVTLLKEKIYPLLKKFIDFYLGIMHRDTDGIYHLDWSIPPEIFSLTRDETASVSMLKTCLKTAIEASEILNEDTEKRKEWNHVLQHYPNIAVHPDGGWWCGPDIPFDHYCYGGHLLYPYFHSEMYPDKKRAKKTLEYVKKYAVEISELTPEPHPSHEWSAFITTAVKLRLNKTTEAWNDILKFLDYFGKPNGLFSHNCTIFLPDDIAEKSILSASKKYMRSFDGKIYPFTRSSKDVTTNQSAKKMCPPVLEGSGAFVFLITETLLQSWDGIIRLFPGVPKNFTGSFSHFLAKGGFDVSAEMKDGKIQHFRIVSKEECILKMKNPFNNNPKIITKKMKENQIFEQFIGF